MTMTLEVKVKLSSACFFFSTDITFKCRFIAHPCSQKRFPTIIVSSQESWPANIDANLSFIVFSDIV